MLAHVLPYKALIRPSWARLTPSFPPCGCQLQLHPHLRSLPVSVSVSLPPLSLPLSPCLSVSLQIHEYVAYYAIQSVRFCFDKVTGYGPDTMNKVGLPHPPPSLPLPCPNWRS